MLHNVAWPRSSFEVLSWLLLALPDANISSTSDLDIDNASEPHQSSLAAPRIVKPALPQFFNLEALSSFDDSFQFASYTPILHSIS